MPYDAPTVADLKARYPGFADVADETIGYWIEDSARGVDESWVEADYQPALLALAAHNMMARGIGAQAAGSAAGASGLTSFKSGDMSLSFSSEAVAIAAKGGFASTLPGRDYLALLHRNRGGPRVVGGGSAYMGDGYNGYAGPLPAWHA